MMPPRLLYIVNIPRFFVSHRLPLALAARAAGYNVHVATSAGDNENIAAIQQAGLPFHQLPISQHGTRLSGEVSAFRAIYKLYSSLKPDIVHQVTIKPVLYGSLAAQLLRVPVVVNALTGLGSVFTSQGFKWSVIRSGASVAYRITLNRSNTCTIFQNPDDRARFVSSGMIDESRTVLIKGSGVDMVQFRPQPELESTPVVLFAGRLLWQKGIGEFVEMARRCQAEGIKARFVVVGYHEPSSPAAVPSEQLQQWQQEGIIEWWGKRTDMPQVFAQVHVVCLPSSYGEGVPKVLIEAAACGRAIVTTDTPGCREIARQGENGLLVAQHEPDALYRAVRQLVENPDLRRQMGERGRQIAEAEFSLDRICQETLTVYEHLLSRRNQHD